MMLLLGLALATGDAPSFDCKKAADKIELSICADPELAAADRAMAKLYAGVSRRDRKARLEQSEWLAETRSRCVDRDCLLEAYEERLWDLFVVSKAPTQDYVASEIHGTLTILDAGNGWSAFNAQGLWIGSAPGQVNDAQATGVFRLTNGKAERASSPTRYRCGWRIERLPGDLWELTEIPYMDDRIGCGGVNATVTGLYSR